MRYIFLIICLFSIISLSLILKSNNIEIKPINLDRNNMCASDAMIIVHYNGPKAQILWKDGTRSFYCEAREAFYELLDKIQNKRILACYVQDFSNLEWGSYIDKWILASEAYYVIDSSKDGAMGLTYVPFSDIKFAKMFLQTYGGKLLKFDEIDANTLTDSANLLKNRMIF